jgi:polar amino acid transport system permease protein
LPQAKIVGQFAAPGGDRWGMLLEHDSQLTGCLNRALAKVSSSGELKRLQDKWRGGDAAPAAAAETFFSWASLKASFPDALKGFWLDVRMFVIVEAVVLALGLAIALVRTSAAPALAPLRLLGTVWVDVLRGVPTILVVYLVGFGVPALELAGVPSNPVVLGGAALAASSSAHVAEVYRTGIDSIHPSQRAAALALELTGRQALRIVVLPQAVRRVVPPLLNDFISLQKDVALVSIVGPLEALGVAQIAAASIFEYTPLVAAALLYLCAAVLRGVASACWRTSSRPCAREVADELCFLHAGAILERARRPRCSTPRGSRRPSGSCAGCRASRAPRGGRAAGTGSPCSAGRGFSGCSAARGPRAGRG